MRILIINGYSKDQAGQKRFSEFQYIIMKICAEQKELVDTETECYIRDKDNIDDFIYEMDSGNMRKEAAQNFDQLDIVFVCGDANVRPWSPSMKKILTLIRMCIKVRKNLFACSFGMQAIIYLCASNIEKQINVLNGNGNGGKLTEDQKMNTKNLSQIQHTDYLLDNTTGDLYGFQYETGEWVPKGNVGMHYRRSAQEFQSIGKFVLKAPTYKPNRMHDQKYKIYKQRYYEDICQIKNMYLQDWALEGMENEFIVPLKNAWDVHTFTFINPQKVFSVLAESQLRGPLILKSHNMISTMFPVDQKYPNSLKPIKNFILYTLKKIKSQTNYYQIPIQAALHEHKQNQVMDALKRAKQKSRNKTLDLMSKRSFKVNVKQEKKQQKHYDEYSNNKFRHVGFSAKKEHVPDFYDQNNMRVTKIKLQPNTQRSSGGSIDLNSNGPGRVQSLHIPGQKSIKFADNLENTLNSNQNRQQLKSVQSQRDLHQKNIPKIKLNNFQNSVQNNNDNQENLEEFGLDISQQLSDMKEFSCSNVRKLLHPELSKEFLSSKKLWVPGQLSQRDRAPLRQKSQHETLMQSTFNTSSKQQSFLKKDNKQLGGVWKSQLNSGTFFQPHQSSIFTGTLQLTQNEIFREYQKEQDKKIIGNKTFKVSNSQNIKLEDLSTTIKKQKINENSQLNSSLRSKLKYPNKNKMDYKIM